MDLSITEDQTQGSHPTYQATSRPALWWVTAVLLAGIIAIVLPIQKIRLLGLQLGGTIGSYTTTPPPAPQYAAISPGGSSLTVYWSQVSAATSYSVYRSDLKDSQGHVYAIGSGSSTSSGNYTDTSATSGKSYTYWVTASNGGAESPGSPSVSATVNTPTPPAPAHGKLIVNGGSIKAYFSTVSGADSYNAYRDGWLMQTGVTSPYTDSGVLVGTSHWYTFAAVNSNGQGDMGPYGLYGLGGATPPVTTKMAATAGANSVQLSWNSVTDTNGGSVSYNLYRSSSAGGEGDLPVQNWISSNNSGPMSYSDNDVVPGVTYYYKVAAVSYSGGEGTLSNEASATPVTPLVPVPLLPAPNLSATAGDGSASLSWTAVAGATSYNVYRSNYSDPAGKGSVPLVEVGGSGTTYTDSGLTNGSSGYYTWYYYTVYAVSKDGQGASSQSVSVDPGSPAPTLKSHVLWTSDYTVTPNVQTGSDSGAVGGNTTLHLSLLIPPNLTSAVAKTVTIHEDAGITPDVTATDVIVTPISSYNNYFGWSAVCGDPDPRLSNSPGMAYGDIPWSSGGQNGPYTITVNVLATIGNSATPQSLAQIIHVDRQDPVIASQTPKCPAPLTPINWDPYLSPQNVQLTATVSAAQRANRTVTAQIFDVNANLVKTISTNSQIGGTQGSSAVNLTWDGSFDINPFVWAPSNLYQVRWSVTNTDGSGSGDTDRSTGTTINPFQGQLNSSPTDATYSFASGDQMSITVHYNIQSSTPASSGRVDVFDPNGSALQTSPLTAASLTPGDHNFEVQVNATTLKTLGTYTFLITVQDPFAAQDIANRNRWALSIANYLSYAEIPLTEPGDGVNHNAPMMFRGAPTPCPIVMNGSLKVAVQEIPVIKYTYERGYFDLNQIWQQTAPQTQIPSSDLITPAPNFNSVTKAFDFRATWNQALPRTMNPLPKAVNQERVRLHAFAIVNSSELPAISANPGTDIKVLAMQNPVPGSSVTSDWILGDKVQRKAYLRSFSRTNKLDPTDKNKMRFLPMTVLFGSSGSHFAVDLKARGLTPILSAEAGTVQKGDHYDPFMLAPDGFDRGTADALYKLMSDSLSQANIDYSLQLTEDNMRDALIFVVTQRAGSNDDNILGVNVKVVHGPVNLRLFPNGNVQTGTLNTLYCHLETAGDGSALGSKPVGVSSDIGTQVGEVGQWYANYTPLEFAVDPDLLLARGWFSLSSVTVQLVRLDLALGEPIFDSKGNMLVVHDKNKNVVQLDIPTIAFPSITGEHLHFEVRVDEESGSSPLDASGMPLKFLNNKPIIFPDGQEDPNLWIKF